MVRMRVISTTILEKSLSPRVRQIILSVLLPVFWGGVVFFQAPAAWAQEKREREEWEESLIQDNIAISEFFDGIAEGLDLFLVGRKLTNRPNETSVRLDSAVYVMDGEGLKSSLGLGVNLRLPNLEEYWHLKFTTYDEKQERRNVRRGYLRQTPRQTNYGATVGFFKKLGDVRTSFEPRIELQDPLKISHSLTFESVADMRKYEVNPKLEFFTSPTMGVGFFTAVNVNFQLSTIYSLTFINEGEYHDKIHEFSVNNGVSLGQKMDDVSSFSYDFMVGSNNRPSYHLESYSFSVSWMHLLYKKILDYRITPHLDFAKDYSFIGRPGLVFAVSLNF